jgi:hypothetical protein
MIAEHRAMMNSEEIKALQRANEFDPPPGDRYNVACTFAAEQSCEDEFLSRSHSAATDGSVVPE